MLTDKQEKVLGEITKYISMYGKSPTIEELQSILGQKSKRGVIQYLDSLEKKGFITRGRGFRSIKLGNAVGLQTMLNIPILGVTNAGKALSYADEADNGYLPVSKSYIKGDKENYFCVRIEGTSMNNFKLNGKFIENGSYVLINKEYNDLNQNDAYLFIVDTCATIKKVKKEGNSLYLLPKSRDTFHKPIILEEYDEFDVNGKVVDVFNFD